MKTAFFLFIFGYTSFVQAQTAIIAHKSHSGTAADFFIDPNTNFGEPGPQLVQLVRLNDSTYIQVFYEFSGMIYHDTVHKNRRFNNYNPKVDSIYQQGYYKQHVEYINLKNTPDTGRVRKPSLQLNKMIEQPIVAPENQDVQQIQEENAPKKKKKSYLLFLFVVTGGGLLAFRVLNRIFTPGTAA